METRPSLPRPEHLPGPTYTPAIVALGIMLLAWGAVTTVALVALGAVLLFVGVGGWIVEMRHER